MRRLLSLLLTLAMVLSPVQVQGVGERTTHYELYTGVVFAWCNSAGQWQQGIEAGKSYENPRTTVYDIAAKYPSDTVENVQVYAYTLDFDFSKLRDNWNKTQFANDKASYDANYYFQSISELKMSDSWNQQTGKLEYTYSGTLDAIGGQPVDVKWYLGKGKIDTIYAMMGYTSETAPGVIKTAMEELYPKAGQSENVQGFLYFVPYIIQYDVVPAGLLPPKVLIDCKATSMFIGLTTPVRGAVQNRNTVPVITRYRLTANDTLLKGGTDLQEAGKSLKVEGTYTFPAATKPGKLFTFRLWAEQTAAYTAPDRYLPREEGEPPVENPAYTAFAAAHTYVPQAGAWYKNDAPWLPGQAECKKTAVLQPEAPLDHRLNPAVIVE